ncbi:MAG: SpoIID/LytB domain-containing protein [Candidatus Sumerlaeaceae bacterium]
MLVHHLSLRRILSVAVAATVVLGLAPSITSSAYAAQAAPSSIRVGRSCSCNSCSTVVTVSMETYTKRVLPQEWITSWHTESLKAGAIAIRSYGAYYVYHPISSSYDICDTTCCQVYSTTQYASTDAAVDATAGVYLVDVNGNIARAEYSAENNDSAGRDGCGNCYTSNKPSDGVCLSDSVCCGYTQNGHGRGMCQWGSQRWALNRGMGYAWIVDHYYAAYPFTRQTLTSGGTGVTITIDNSSAGFSASSNWSTGTSAADKYGTDYRYRSTAAVSDAAQWSASISSSGTYNVSAWWSQGSNRSATAPYILPNGTSVSKNQQAGGGVWNLLGTSSLTAGTSAVTKLSCWTTTGYIVLADAIKYTK